MTVWSDLRRGFCALWYNHPLPPPPSPDPPAGFLHEHTPTLDPILVHGVTPLFVPPRSPPIRHPLSPAPNSFAPQQGVQFAAQAPVLYFRRHPCPEVQPPTHHPSPRHPSPYGSRWPTLEVRAPAQEPTPDPRWNPAVTSWNFNARMPDLSPATPITVPPSPQPQAYAPPSPVVWVQAELVASPQNVATKRARTWSGSPAAQRAKH